jgi:hypothetical protein
LVSYCPPAVGYAERNSAIDAAKAKLQIPAVMRPQSTLVEPPDGSARPSEDESAVQEFKMAKASPSMERRLKLRFSSPLWPRAWSCASSSSWACSAVFIMGIAKQDQLHVDEMEIRSMQKACEVYINIDVG